MYVTSLNVSENGGVKRQPLVNLINASHFYANLIYM